MAFSDRSAHLASLSLTTGISAASVELRGLSALSKARFPIAGSVCPVGQWIRDEWNLKKLKYGLCRFSVFLVSKKRRLSSAEGSFRSFITLLVVGTRKPL